VEPHISAKACGSRRVAVVAAAVVVVAAAAVAVAPAAAAVAVAVVAVAVAAAEAAAAGVAAVGAPAVAAAPVARAPAARARAASRGVLASSARRKRFAFPLTKSHGRVRSHRTRPLTFVCGTPGVTARVCMLTS